MATVPGSCGFARIVWQVRSWNVHIQNFRMPNFDSVVNLCTRRADAESGGGERRRVASGRGRRADAGGKDRTCSASLRQQCAPACASTPTRFRSAQASCEANQLAA